MQFNVTRRSITKYTSQHLAQYLNENEKIYSSLSIIFYITQLLRREKGKDDQNVKLKKKHISFQYKILYGVKYIPECITSSI